MCEQKYVTYVTYVMHRSTVRTVGGAANLSVSLKRPVYALFTLYALCLRRRSRGIL